MIYKCKDCRWFVLGENYYGMVASECHHSPPGEHGFGHTSDSSKACRKFDTAPEHGKEIVFTGVRKGKTINYE